MKTGLLITARLKSKRLPYKILKDLNGHNVIERVIDRAKVIEGIGDIILCTSTNKQDRPLIDIAIKNGIYYFTGSEDDVLQRLLTASELFELDYIINVTADNPLFSISHADKMMNEIRKDRYDYLKPVDLPFGGLSYGLKVKALKLVCKIKEIVDTEIWGYLFQQPEIFSICEIKSNYNIDVSSYRLTLDYPEDYDLINHLFQHITFEKVLDFDKTIEYLSNNPELLKINKDVIQRNISDDEKCSIDIFFEEHRGEILKIKNKIYSE